MRVLIIYYSRTGTTKYVADQLATKLNADVVEICCKKYKWPMIGYILAGYDSLRGNLAQIQLKDVDLNSYDLVILGTPVWTSYPAVPMRSYLSRRPNFVSRLGVFITHGEHSPAEVTLEHLERLLERPIESSLVVNAGTALEHLEPAIDDFLTKTTDRQYSRSLTK